MLGGVAGYLNWPFDNDELLNTFDRMLEAHKAHERQQSLMAAGRRQVAQLTSREREVLSALLSGMATREMARVLHLSPRTVEIHRASVMAKLHTRSVAEAVKIALFAGLDEASDWENRAA